MQLRPCFQRAYKKASLSQPVCLHTIIKHIYQSHHLSSSKPHRFTFRFFVVEPSAYQRQPLCLAPPRPVNLLYIYRGVLSATIKSPFPTISIDSTSISLICHQSCHQFNMPHKVNESNSTLSSSGSSSSGDQVVVVPNLRGMHACLDRESHQSRRSLTRWSAFYRV